MQIVPNPYERDATTGSINYLSHVKCYSIYYYIERPGIVCENSFGRAYNERGEICRSRGSQFTGEFINLSSENMMLLYAALYTVKNKCTNAFTIIKSD